MARLTSQKTLLLLLAILVQWMVLPRPNGSGCETSRPAQAHTSCCCAGLDTGATLAHGCCGKDKDDKDVEPPCRCSDADPRTPLLPIAPDKPDFDGGPLCGDAPRTAGFSALTQQAYLRPQPIPRCRTGPPIHVRDCVFLI